MNPLVIADPTAAIGSALPTVERQELTLGELEQCLGIKLGEPQYQGDAKKRKAVALVPYSLLPIVSSYRIVDAQYGIVTFQAATKSAGTAFREAAASQQIQPVLMDNDEPPFVNGARKLPKLPKGSRRR